MNVEESLVIFLLGFSMHSSLNFYGIFLKPKDHLHLLHPSIPDFPSRTGRCAEVLPLTFMVTSLLLGSFFYQALDTKLLAKNLMIVCVIERER